MEYLEVYRISVCANGSPWFVQVDTIRQRHGEACRMPVPHHFFLSLKSFTYNTIGEDTDVFFSLYDVREGKQIR